MESDDGKRSRIRVFDTGNALRGLSPFDREGSRGPRRHGKNPGRMNEPVRCLESGDPVVRGRAADALEKWTAKRPAARSRKFDGTWRRCCRGSR
jgi:hypothetical protein